MLKNFENQKIEARKGAGPDSVLKHLTVDGHEAGETNNSNLLLNSDHSGGRLPGFFAPVLWPTFDPLN